MLWLFVLFVVAVAFWAAGGLLLYVRHRARRKVDLIRQTQTTDASGISAFSPGTSVEVKGTLRCESPLQSEMAEESCACYTSRVTREYVRSSGPSSDDSPGSHHPRQTASETLSEVVRAVPFFVEDETGRVEVHPEGSEVDARKVVDRFEPSASPGFTLGGAPVSFDEEASTLGYRYTESVLPTDAPVYVLGVVREDGGIGAGPGSVDAPVEELPLMKGGELASTLPSSRDKERRFVISHRSEEALEQDLARTVFWMAVAAVGALAVGVVVAVAGFLVAIG
jgi:E3 Ubiquitin ligase